MVKWHRLNVLFGISKRSVFTLVGLMLVSSLGEGISLLLLVPLLHYAGITHNQSGASQHSWLTGFIPQHMSLFTVLLVYCVVVITFACWNYAKTLYGAQFLQRTISCCRQRLFGVICHAPWSLLSKQTPSHMSQMLTTEIQRISAALQQSIQLLANGLVSATYLIVALYLSWKMTSMALCACAVLLFITRKHTAFAKRNGRQTFYFFRDVHKTIEQTLHGLKQAKLWQSEARYIDQLDDCNDTLKETQVQFANSQAVTQWLFTSGAALIISVIFYISRVYLHVALSHVLVLIISFARILPKMASAQKSYQLAINNLSGFNTVLWFYQQCHNAVVDDCKTALPPVQRDISINQLSYKHPGSEHATLSGVNMNVPVGGITAITGSSGCGKSTLMDCLAGLLVPQHGQIEIDGVALKDGNRASWLKQVAYVSQDPFLLHATIRENMLWVRPDATDEEIWSALSLAQAESFVRQLPLELNSEVGDRGLRMSGGERQRIVLAQAILKGARLLILDEATSQLDNQHEKLIQECLLSLNKRMTIIMIAHRLSSLALADQIILIDQGRAQCVESFDALQATYAIEA